MGGVNAGQIFASADAAFVDIMQQRVPAVRRGECPSAATREQQLESVLPESSAQHATSK